ncbi:MAG: dTMP kinase [Candidatus Lokiarchaeota archaeon]|nr:dTMP kinase [Candidatus Lokiarchaeota archaeon]MCK4480876.1 dTMP kinase [Candidatus Lokiarchaeota archaeon]MCK4780333.1 dTMP kinase [Candidatus Lokiarchaeota archaeon]
MTQKALFIALEGGDAAGTTTHSHLLKGFLESKGFKVYLTQEPSQSKIGILIREFLKNKEIPPTTDALLFAADRDLHYKNEIKNKLEERYIVISDRYIESSIVYQSVQSDKITVDWVKEINKFVGLPDITIILDINPKIALARKEAEDLEKFEDSSFLAKVRNLYLTRAKEENYHIISSDDIIEIVQENIQKIVIEKIKNLS